MPGPGSQACPKPVRGALMLEREERQAKALSIEKREKAKAKKRDGGKCRWPEKHKCRGVLESAHILDTSLMGEMAAENLVTLCSWLHRRGPVSIHGKQLRVECETAAGANGPLAFYQQGVDGEFYLVARETAIGVYERD